MKHCKRSASLSDTDFDMWKWNSEPAAVVLGRDVLKRSHIVKTDFFMITEV